MSNLLNPTRELEINPDASGEPIPMQRADLEWQQHSVEIEQATSINNPTRINKNGRAPLARVQAPSGSITGWPSFYAHKLTTVEEALKAITSRSRVYIGGGCGEPVELAQG